MNRFANPQLFARHALMGSGLDRAVPETPAPVVQIHNSPPALECVTCSAKGFKSHKALDRHGRAERHQACARSAERGTERAA